MLAVTPLPTLPDPDVMLRRNFPPLIASELLLPSERPPSISNVPLPDLTQRPAAAGSCSGRQSDRHRQTSYSTID